MMENLNVGSTLLLGVDDGLYTYETDEAMPVISTVSDRKYEQIDVIEELNIFVSRSGKHSVVSTHELAPFLKQKKHKRFETETKVKKMKNTKGCDFYSISKVQDSVYLSIAMPSSVLIMKWAAQPYQKFMKVKEISFDIPIDLIDIVDVNDKSDIKMFIGHELGIKMMDLQTAAAEDISYTMDGRAVHNPISNFPASNPNKIVRKEPGSKSNTSTGSNPSVSSLPSTGVGRPIKVSSFVDGAYVLCYQSKRKL
jgi:hypothetical protein